KMSSDMLCRWLSVLEFSRAASCVEVYFDVRNSPPPFLHLRSVAQQGPGRLEVRPVEHARNSLLGREVHDLRSVLEGQAIADQEERVRTLSGHLGQDALEIRRASHLPGLKLDAQYAGRILDFPP